MPACQQTIVTRNGEIVKLAPGCRGVIGEVPTGRLVADGKSLLPLAGETLKSRQRMTFNGAALATLVLDRDGKLSRAAAGDGAGPRRGRRRRGGRTAPNASRSDRGSIAPRDRRDDEAVREAARIAIRRALKACHGKRPVTDIHVVRI